MHPALKHGAYSATLLVEDSNFKRLHRGLIADFKPVGTFEKAIIGDLARLMSCKQNLIIFRIAELARKRDQQILAEKLPDLQFHGILNPAEEKKLRQAAEDQARKELGENYELIEMGETATLDCLIKELDVEERVNRQIDRCLRQFFLVRGLKSVAQAPAYERIAGPKKAA
jgi:hypothetical protein